MTRHIKPKGAAFEGEADPFKRARRHESRGLMRDLLKEALDQRFEDVELYH